MDGVTISDVTDGDVVSWGSATVDASSIAFQITATDMTLIYIDQGTAFNPGARTYTATTDITDSLSI